MRSSKPEIGGKFEMRTIKTDQSAPNKANLKMGNCRSGRGGDLFYRYRCCWGVRLLAPPSGGHACFAARSDGTGHRRSLRARLAGRGNLMVARLAKLPARRAGAVPVNLEVGEPPMDGYGGRSGPVANLIGGILSGEACPRRVEATRRAGGPGGRMWVRRIWLARPLGRADLYLML